MHIRVLGAGLAHHKGSGQHAQHCLAPAQRNTRTQSRQGGT